MRLMDATLKAIKRAILSLTDMLRIILEIRTMQVKANPLKVAILAKVLKYPKESELCKHRGCWET